jgi:ferric-dicitrate binding protein FerR (iron transport regulator)
MKIWLRAGLALLILSMTGTSGMGQTAKDVAVMIKTAGKVEVNKSTNGGWQTAAKGTRLDAGNQVRTGEQSLAAVVFTDDKSLLKVRDNSTVTINGKRENNRIAKTITMEAGQLWAKVTKGQTNFRVETPSGVAAVKGTEFYGVLDDNGNFYIFCTDGIVELFNRLGRVLVEQGYTGMCSQTLAPETNPTDVNQLPNWGNQGEQGGELEIEFQDENGNKKKLKIQYE